jgi:small redox-active disulfide protein 2
MEITIVGPDCSRCRAPEANVRKASDELHLSARIRKVDDVREYAKLGVRLTPAVLVDGRIVSSGKVPNVEELKGLLFRTNGASARRRPAVGGRSGARDGEGQGSRPRGRPPPRRAAFGPLP